MNWWRHVLALEFRKILAFRSDFWVTFIGQTLVQLFIAKALWSSLYEAQGVTEMNGYTLPMMTLYYLIAPLGQKILIGANVGFIAREIYDGSFSRYLIYPLSAFQYKAITYVAHSLFYFFQLILIVTLYMVFFLPGKLNSISMINVLQGASLYLLAAMTYGMLHTIIELLSLWVDNIWSLAVMLRFSTSFCGGGLIPLTFFPEWAQEALKYTPYPYLVSLPIRTIMGLSNQEEMLRGILMLTFWLFIGLGGVKLIWNRGQLRYTGAGQ